MKKKYIRLLSIIFMIFIFAITAQQNLFSQNNPVHFNFDTTLANSKDSILIYVKNPLNLLLNVNSVRTLTSNFYAGITSFSINALDSFPVKIYFKTNQNVTYNDFIIFECAELNYSIINYLTATAVYSDTTYRFTQGLYDEQLKTALKNFCSVNTNNNYTASRTAMFSTIDDYNMNDTIECVYTGRKVYTTGIPSVNPPQSMNTEHTFPQGFFSQNEPMRSDIHHLFPSDEEANNRRNNYDFGFVVSNITWQNSGSKLGMDAGGNIVFESRDAHKGNIARCLFYFLIRYQNYGGFMDGIQESVLRQWNRLDTVDLKERIRNNGIYAFQNNRSPFVDHPEFIDRIKSTYSVIPNIPKPEISASPYSARFDTLAVNDTASFLITLFNYGTGNLNINSVTSSLTQFTVENFPSTVPQNEFSYLRIKFKPNLYNQTFNSTLTIDNNDSTITVNLTGYSNNTIGISSANEIPFQFSLSQNYPNPFNPFTAINYQLPKSGFVTLNIHGINGKLIKSLVNHRQSPGSYKIEWDASEIPSGIYFYTLQLVNENIDNGNFTMTRKMILAK